MTYTPNSINVEARAPSWKIPTSKRELTSIKNKNPGSGKYEYHSFIGEGPHYSIRPKYDLDGITEGKRNSKAYKKSNVPGPGHYNPLDNTHGPRYTISAKYRSKRKKGDNSYNVPGVGSYNLRNDNLNVPSTKFDKENRINGNLNHSSLGYPGPGRYKNDMKGMSTNGPKWTFSKSERLLPNKEDPDNKTKKVKRERPQTPGPGSYAHRTYIGKEGPQYHFPKEKLNHGDAVDAAMEKKTADYPAPGQYQRDIRYRPDSAQYTIPKGTRSGRKNDNKNVSNYPAPDKYNPNHEMSSKHSQAPIYSVGKSKREDESNTESKVKRPITPGPGHYNVNQGTFPQGPRYTMSAKYKNKKGDNYPGPGTYSFYEEPLPKEVSYDMEKLKKKIKFIKKDNFPGPGTYNVPDVNLTKTYITFPKDKKLKGNLFNTPGPGAYKIPTAFDYISNMSREKGVWDPNFRYV